MDIQRVSQSLYGERDMWANMGALKENFIVPSAFLTSVNLTLLKLP